MHEGDLKITELKSNRGIETITDLYRETIYSEHKKELVARLISNKLTYHLIAKKNSQIVGAISLIVYDFYGKEAIVEINKIGVKKEIREKGTGTELIRKGLKLIKNKLKRRKMKIAMVIVYTDGENRGARKFYEKTLRKIGYLKEITIKRVWSKTDSGNKAIVMFVVKVDHRMLNAFIKKAL